MRQYQKLLTLAAVVAATALTGCASRQPSTSVVVVPTTPSAPTAQATSGIRTGKVVAIQNTSAAGASASASSQGASSTGGATASGAASPGQLLTVQFDDGQIQFFQVSSTDTQFKVGDSVTVNATQGPAIISR